MNLIRRMAGVLATGAMIAIATPLTAAPGVMTMSAAEADPALEPREVRFENGAVKEAWFVRTEPDGAGGEREVKHGPVVWRHATGGLDRTGYYADDAETGMWTYWWNNGQLKGRGPYVDGAKNGMWTFWAETGERDHGRYVDEKRQGVWRRYDAAGHELARLTFKDDELSGPAWQFAPDGSLVQYVEYENGVRHGEMRRWTTDGTPLLVATFDRGKREGLFREWWPDGKAKTLGHYEQDTRVGTWKTWYENGDRENWESLGVYVEGSPHGYWVTKKDGNRNFALKVYAPGGRPFEFPEEWMVRWYGSDESAWPVKRPPTDGGREELTELLEDLEESGQTPMERNIGPR
ncbi:MAG: hypothetical protein RIB32_03695 [Phycisphaerales bacterium]